MDDEEIFGKEEVYPEGLIILKGGLTEKYQLKFVDNQMMSFGRINQFKQLTQLALLKLNSIGFNRPYFDQSIINRYQPGQGIKPHVDLNRFEDGIVVACVKGNSMMVFVHKDLLLEYEVYLEENDIILLTGSSRYDWMHSIPERDFDMVDGVEIKRTERHSITLRKMILDESGISRELDEHFYGDEY
jgi:alkylated DNA repair dioxygenase AlkB